MKTHLVSFSTPQYRRSQKRLEVSAVKFGIDVLHSFTEKDLKKTPFYKENQAILKQPRGFGYWLWKPFFILETLKKVEKDDIVLYLDAANEVIAPLKPLFDLCDKQDVNLFQVHTHKNKIWTKRDTFIGMDCDAPFYYESEQILGSPHIYRVNDASKEFVSCWLFYCQNAAFLTDQPNIFGAENLPEFRGHRHDQSIVSLLGLKRKLIVHRDPAQWGNDFKEAYPHSEYEQILDLHRTNYRVSMDKIKREITEKCELIKIALKLK